MWCRISFFIRVGEGIVTNEELVSEYQKGDEKAFEELLTTNYAIIVSMIKRWFVKDGAFSYDEIESDCVYGFFLAANEYSPDKGCSFSTYAFQRIQWFLIKTVYKRTPKDNPEQPITILSISDNVPGTDDLKYEDLIPDESAEQDYQKVLDCISNMTLRKRILFFLDSICSEKEKEVLICHYGVGCEPKSLTTLADSFGVSTERIRQIKNKAILKLRNSPLKNTMFSEFEFQSDTSKRKELLLQQINTKEKKQKSYEDAIKALENL